MVTNVLLQDVLGLGAGCESHLGYFIALAWMSAAVGNFMYSLSY